MESNTQSQKNQSIQKRKKKKKMNEHPPDFALDETL